jgi:hypothetical protein
MVPASQSSAMATLSIALDRLNPMEYSFADSQLSVLDFAQYIQKDGYADTIEDLRRIREEVKREVCSVSLGTNEGSNL